MNLLLDTCTLLWWVRGDELSTEAAQAIADPENGVWVSAASVSDISIKRSEGKLEPRQSRRSDRLMWSPCGAPRHPVTPAAPTMRGILRC